MILNIETSANPCSVALCDQGEIIISRRDDTPLNHARALAPMVQECMDYLRRHDTMLDAVAVSIGPGSYTGLRIGLSLAKGLCMGLQEPDKPVTHLIGIPTLSILASQALFHPQVQDAICADREVLIIPMIDARRMEVYTATYNSALQEIQPARPLILEPDSFGSLAAEYPDAEIFVAGVGSSKYMDLCATPGIHFLQTLSPTARDMMPLSEQALRKGDCLDLAYSIPLYLKDFQATTPKNKVLNSMHNA